MIDALHRQPRVFVSFSPHAGGTWHVDLSTNTWTRVSYAPGSSDARAYDVVADSKNNMYGVGMRNDKIWKTYVWTAGMDNDLAVRLTRPSTRSGRAGVRPSYSVFDFDVA